MSRVVTVILSMFLFACNLSTANAKLTLKEVRTASNDVLVAFFTSDKIDVNEVEIDDLSEWKVNGKPVKNIYKYAVQADPCDHHIYLQTEPLVNGEEYSLNTPYGDTKIAFNPKTILCESIKVNQAGYSALSKKRYANFATGKKGDQNIIGCSPNLF